MDAWSVVGIAAAVGSTVAAIVSAALVLWFRYRDRPSADWLLEPLNFARTPSFEAVWHQISSGTPDEQIVLTNVGDGTAYRVEAEGNGCKVMLYHTDPADLRGFSTPAAVARVLSAEHFGVFIWHDDIAARDKERVTLTWHETPTRHRRKRSEKFDYPSELRAMQDRFERDHKNAEA